MFNYFAGCSTGAEIEKKTEKVAEEPKQECSIEEKNLQKICTVDPVESLDITTLMKCDWIAGDKDSFLTSCTEGPTWWKISGMFNDYINDSTESKESIETNFEKQLLKLCSAVKVGNLSLPEVDICFEVIDSTICHLYDVE